MLLLLSIVPCNAQKKLPAVEVNYLSSADGTVTMRAIGTGSNEQKAIALAEQNAINVLLFRGLPESEQKEALIGNGEAEAKESNKQYFDKLYKERYKLFIMSSVPVTTFAKQKGGVKSITMDVKVNLVALRKDLEQNNIIRKFGF